MTMIYCWVNQNARVNSYANQVSEAPPGGRTGDLTQ